MTVNLKTYKISIFWFTSVFLDAIQKFSPSIRGKPEILTKNKTILPI